MSKIAFFDNSGVLINTSDRQHDDIFDDREIAHQADYYVIGSHKYDLSNPDSISSIPIPNFKPGNAALLDMSYITKIRCGAVEDAELIPAFVSKTLDIMIASKLLWTPRDYLQVIRNYYRCDLIDSGEVFEADFRLMHFELFESLKGNPIEGEHLSTKYYFENRNRRYAEYETVKAICPDLVPPTVTGYLQIRTRRTKRFQQIQSICEEHGIVFDFSKNRHFCKKFNTYVDMLKEYDHAGRYPKLSSCLCSLFAEGICNNPVSENGLSCIFQAEKKSIPYKDIKIAPEESSSQTIFQKIICLFFPNSKNK